MKNTFASKTFASWTFASGHWAGVGVEIVAIPPDQLRLTLELHQSFGVQVVLHKSIQLTLER